MHIDHVWAACFANYKRRSYWKLGEDFLHLRYREYYWRQCRQWMIRKTIKYSVARVQRVTEFQSRIATLFGVALLVFSVFFLSLFILQTLMNIFLPTKNLFFLNVNVEEKMTYSGLQNKHIYAWHAKWVVGSKEKKGNLAVLTSQFNIKCNLEWREFAKVMYANFSK